MINIEHINKSYKKHIVLSDVSMNADIGQCIGIIGSNGAGKTTLLSIICGLTKADGGCVKINDVTIINNKVTSPNILNYISYIPQVNPLIEDLSALDNLRLWYTGASVNLKESLSDGILNSLGINEFLHKTVSKLSGGMKKRLSIGIALANDVPVLIMDEPSSSLDLSGKHEVREYIKYLTQELHKTIIIASHDESELSLCDRLYLLKDSMLKEIEHINMSSDELINLL